MPVDFICLERMEQPLAALENIGPSTQDAAQGQLNGRNVQSGGTTSQDKAAQTGQRALSNLPPRQE